MEALIRENYFDGVLDITTTELADELCGGICSAGSERLEGAGETALPQVVVPGCMDMVNFGSMDTVPEIYKYRYLYGWAPDVTLMRTNEEENIQLGEKLATKINQSLGPSLVLLPLKGLSELDSQGKEFYRPEINQMLFSTIKQKVREPIKVSEVEAHINDPKFSKMLVTSLMTMMEKGGKPNDGENLS